MSSKRKAPEPTGGKAAGKRRLEDDATDEQLSSLLDDDDTSLETDLVAGADELAEALDGDDALLDGGEECSADEAEELLRLQTQESCASLIDTAAEEMVGELPDDLAESQLEEPEEVDLSKVSLTLPQARCVAKHLARNGGLEKVTFESHSLSVSEMKESEELEWDSEEYTDVDAIIIAELLKGNKSVERLDLARNAISDAGASALAAMLTENTTLEYLNLESNTFGERGGEAFCTALASNSSVQYLNLMYNSVPAAVQERIRGEWTHSVGLHL